MSLRGGVYALRTYAEDSSLDCGPLIEAYLDAMGPTTSTERRAGRIPAGDYSVATTIEWPLRAGGELRGSGAETDLYGTTETAAFDGAITRLTWRGASDGGPLMTIKGMGMTLANMSLNGLSATTQANLITNMANRASVGIRVEDRASGSPPFGPGKVNLDVIQMQAFDVALQLGQDNATGNQADQITAQRLSVAYCGKAISVLNQQSVDNRFDAIHCFGVDTVLEYKGGGRFSIGTVSCWQAGAIDDTVVVSVPASSNISPNHCEVSIGDVNFDGTVDEGRLIVMAEAETVRLSVNNWNCTTNYLPVDVNVLRGDAQVRIGHWRNAIANSFECHESGGKCPVIFVDNVDPKTGEDSADLIDPDSTGVCYVVYGGGTVTNAAAPVVRVQTWDDGVLIETKELGTGGGSVATDAIFNAAGDLVYGTGSDTATRLAVGTAGQVLNVNAGATAPAWTSAVNGVTVGSTDPAAGYFDTGFRFYKTGNPGDANTEFLNLTTDAANFYLLGDQSGSGSHRTLNIGTQGAVPLRFRTGGTNRWDVDSSGHFIPITDSTYNIGASGTEVLNVWADTVTVGAEVYGAGWDSDNSAPTKNDVYDKIQTVVAGSGDVATDTIWDAAGDLAVGTGADTAARLAKGTALQVLRVNAGATALEWADVSVSDAELNAMAGLTSAADKLPYFTGSGTAALADLGSAARAILDGATSAEVAALVSNETGTGVLAFATAPTFTTNLTVTSTGGSSILSGVSLQLNDDTSNLAWAINTDGGMKFLYDSALVAELENDGSLVITGGLTLGTPLPVTEGGTGASDVGGVLSNLGLVIGTNVQAFDADLTDLADGELTGTKVEAGSTAVRGTAEAAINTEVDTGTDAARYVTPDALAGSVSYGTKVIELIVFDFATTVATGDGKFYFHVPASLNGFDIVTVHAGVITAGTTGTSDVQIARVRSGTPADVLSTKLTIDSTETGSDTAATPAVINTSNDDLATNDRLRIDVDAVSTTPPKGLIVTIEARKP